MLSSQWAGYRVETLRNTVSAALRLGLARAGLPEASPLVLAVSGGVDSLSLLDLVAQLRPAEGLTVAHFDHGLRPESFAEAEAVMAAAAARGVRGFSERAIMTAGRERAGLEATARAQRYDFLGRVARQAGAPAVVTAHHADDQAETVLMHLLRGSGVAGLRGMALAALLPGAPDLWLLRPLLDISHVALESYALAAGLSPVYDASNHDITYFRNRVRHELLPALETYNPRVRDRLREMATILAAENDLLVGLEVETWQHVAVESGPGYAVLRRDVWRSQPLALRRRLLRRAVAACNNDPVEIGFQAIEAARQVAEDGATGSRASLPGRIDLRVSYDRLELIAIDAATPDAWPQLHVPETDLPVPGAITLAGGWRLAAELNTAVDRSAIAANRDPWTAYVALDDGEALTVRGRRPGERIRPLGMGGSVKLKEVMIDRKIPAPARDSWPLVATAAHPVWLPGHVLDDRIRVTLGSQRIVRLRCWQDDGQPSQPPMPHLE